MMKSGSASGGSRALWLFLDQMLSSFTNFFVSIFIARAASTVEFGSFSVSLALCFLALELLRPLALEPLLIRFSGQSSENAKYAHSGAVSAAVALACALGVVLLCVGLFTNWPASPFLLLGCPVVIALLVQDSCRFCLIADGQAKKAAANDGLWAVLAVSSMLTTSYALASSTYALIIAWATSGLVAALYGLMQLQVIPTWLSMRTWLSDNKDLSRPYVLEYVVDSGGFQLLLLLVGLVGGVESVGALAGARVLFGPVGILFLALLSLGMSEGARMRESGSRFLGMSLRVLGVVLAVLPMIWTFLLLIVPESWGSAVLGDTFYGAAAVLPALGLYWAARGGMLGAKVVFRVSRDAYSNLNVLLSFAPVVVASSVAGAILGGPRGATWSLAAASCACALFAWWRARSKLAQLVSGGS